MNKEEVIKQIKEGKISSWELHELVKDVKNLERRELDQEAIDTKKKEIKVLEERVAKIDAGTYEEPYTDDGNNYYDNR